MGYGKDYAAQGICNKRTGKNVQASASWQDAPDRKRRSGGILDIGLVIRDKNAKPYAKYSLSLYGILYCIDVLQPDKKDVDRMARDADNYSHTQSHSFSCLYCRILIRMASYSHLGKMSNPFLAQTHTTYKYYQRGCILTIPKWHMQTTPSMS